MKITISKTGLRIRQMIKVMLPGFVLKEIALVTYYLIQSKNGLWVITVKTNLKIMNIIKNDKLL